MTMFKKIAMIGAVVALAAAGVMQATPAHAQAAGYSFVSVCGVPNGIDCPPYPFNVQHYGPFLTMAACSTAQQNVQYNSVFGRWPWTTSTCFPQ